MEQNMSHKQSKPFFSWLFGFSCSGESKLKHSVLKEVVLEFQESNSFVPLISERKKEDFHILLSPPSLNWGMCNTILP